jgi:ADP-heptose:LPS heptosyltransferase
MRERWTRARNVLAMRLDNVGDVIMVGPALRQVRAALPAARITLMVSPAGSHVAPMLPWVDDVMTASVAWQDASGAMPLDRTRERALIDRIAARGFDAALIFTSFSQSPHAAAYACYLAGIPLRAGESKEFGGSILSLAASSLPDGAHQVDRNLHLVESAGLGRGAPDLGLRVPAEARVRVQGMLAEAGIQPGEPFFVVAPGASCSARRYDARRFGAAARLVALETAMPCVCAGSSREAAIVDAVLAELGGVRACSLAGRTSIPELVALINASSVAIVNDSGPMHIADAVGTPSVVLYAGTELESQWRPRTSPSVLLRRATACSPCYAFACPYGHECLDIPPEEVCAAALELLGAGPLRLPALIATPVTAGAAGGS